MSDTLDQLASRIRSVLETRSSCPVFGQTIKEVWADSVRDQANQAEAIHDFAKANGFSADFGDPCLLITFRIAA